MKKYQKIIAASLGLGVIATGAVLAARNETGPTAAATPSEPAPLQVTVIHPEVRPVTEWDNYTGRFEAVDHVELQARVSGHLVAIHFADGDLVSEGDTLFTIDPRSFQADLALAKASLAEAEARLTLAETQLARTANLLATNAISQSTHDTAVAEHAGATGAVQAAQARVQYAELNLEFTEIRAPITGRVDRHYVDVGNLIEANGTPLTSIVSMNPIYVSFDVNQAAYLRYTRDHENGTRTSSREAANPVRIALGDENSFSLEGSMEYVANQVHRGTGTIRARAIVENPGHFLTPGLFARVQLLSRAGAETVLLPDEVINAQQSERFVYVVDETNTVRTRAVELGPLVDGQRVIRSGLDATNRVITGNVAHLSVGQAVATNPLHEPTEALVASL